MSKKDKTVHIKLIVNTGAGKPANTSDNLKLVTNYLEQKGLIVDMAVAHPKGRATKIARRAIEDKYKIVVAMGGDGTIEAVMRGMVGSKARLGIIASGTENNIAKSLGIPNDLKEACDLIASDNTLKLDMGQVRTKKGKKFIFFEMVTIGISAAVYPSANKVAHGKLSNIKAAALAYIHHEIKPKVFMTLDDESKVEVETMMVMVSNTPILGINFRVAPDASMQDGLLDISVYPDFSKVELVKYYAAIMNGGYSGEGKVQHYQARKLKVKASPKLAVMADGVSLGNGTVTIKILPSALRIITTEKSLGAGIPQKDVVRIQPVPVPVTVGKNHRVESITSFE